MRLRSLALVAAGLLAAAAPTLRGQEYGPAPSAAVRAEILALREKAWRTWFSNDTTGFKETVPAELVAIGWDPGPWGDRKATIADMGGFAQGGSKLDALEFPENVMQQYGDVVILYTKYRLVLKGSDGRTTEYKGRGTEFFVRRGGKWIHTGWHLDNIVG